MTQNLLRLKDNKTGIIYLASPHCVKSLKTPALQMGASSITSNGSLKNLGVIFDKCTVVLLRNKVGGAIKIPGSDIGRHVGPTMAQKALEMMC